MIIFYAVASCYALWILFLAVMSLKRARDAGTITQAAYCLGMPVLYFGLLFDFVLNFSLFSILMLEPPQEWTVSQRMARHIRDGSGWRRSVALWIGDNLLDKFDPSGKHLH